MSGASYVGPARAKGIVIFFSYRFSLPLFFLTKKIMLGKESDRRGRRLGSSDPSSSLPTVFAPRSRRASRLLKSHIASAVTKMGDNEGGGGQGGDTNKEKKKEAPQVADGIGQTADWLGWPGLQACSCIGGRDNAGSSRSRCVEIRYMDQEPTLDAIQFNGTARWPYGDKQGKRYSEEKKRKDK